MIKVREIMSRDVYTVSHDLSIREAAELLATRHISGAPIVERGRVIGVITATDVLDFISSLPGVPPEVTDRSEWNQLDDHTVEEAMTRGTGVRVTPDTSVQIAAEVMKKAGVHRLLVMDGEELLGIVSTLDIVRALADHRLAARTFVFPRPGALS